VTVPQNRIAILFNPSAAKGKALGKKTRLERLLRELDVSCDLMVTASEENLRALTRECAGRYRALAGAGGDSTFQIMVDELARSGANVDLGLIPLGSSNDVAREFDLQSLEKACRALKEGRAKPVDLGAVEEDGSVLGYFLGQANIGLGARVNRYVEEMAGRSPRLARFQNLAGALGVVRSYRRKEIPLKLEVRAGGLKKGGSFIVASFSNIRFWASGRLFIPSARPDDGLLDGCLIKHCSFLRLARLASLARRGRHVGAPEVEFVSSPAFDVSAEREFEIQVDGEIIGGSRTPQFFTRVRILALPGALRLICG
jgi:diacylglycerol kinase (ATP)